MSIADLDPKQVSAAIVQKMEESQLFKPWTSYITIGDEPKSVVGMEFVGVFNLRTKLSSSQLQDFKSLFRLMPRKELRGWFNENVLPTLGKDQYGRPENEDLIWGAIIDIFNEANLEVLGDLNPWEHEQKKERDILVAKNKPAMDALEAELDSYISMDPERLRLTKLYMTLPKLGDPGLNLNRENAIFQLLNQKEYKTVQAVIDAYRYSDQSVLSQALREPIPFNIVAEDGTMIRATATE